MLDGDTMASIHQYLYDIECISEHFANKIGVRVPEISLGCIYNHPIVHCAHIHHVASHKYKPVMCIAERSINIFKTETDKRMLVAHELAHLCKGGLKHGIEFDNVVEEILRNEIPIYPFTDNKNERCRECGRVVIRGRKAPIDITGRIICLKCLSLRHTSIVYLHPEIFKNRWAIQCWNSK
jgi:hypothetical protein